MSLETIVPSFLVRVKRISHETCGDRLVSIRQFGSVLDGQYREGLSDIDVIILVSDDCHPDAMESLRRQLVQLEIDCDIAGLCTIGSFQRVIMSRTALFKLHFVLHRSALELQQYSRLFKEAEVLSLSAGSHFSGLFRLLLPWKLVLANIVSQSRLVMGSDSLGDYKPLIAWRVEAIKSFLAALAMSVIAIVLTTFSEDGTRLSLEATKWYLIDESSCLLGRRTGLTESIEYFRSTGTGLFLRNFKRLRMSYSSDRFFAFACPIFLLWFQLMAIRRNRRP